MVHGAWDIIMLMQVYRLLDYSHLVTDLSNPNTHQIHRKGGFPNDKM